MEKELFLSTLKDKSQVDNLSDRSFDEVATMWLPLFSDDSKITEESWSMPIQMVKTMSGQLRHDISTGIGEAKSQWEKDAATARQKAVEAALSEAKAAWEKPDDIKPAPLPQPPIDLENKISEAVSAAVKDLVSEKGLIGMQNKKLDDFISAYTKNEKAKQEAEIKGKIRKHLISRGVDDDDYALEITMEKLAIGDTPDLKALTEKAEKDYEAIFKRMYKNGAQPFAGGAGGAGGGQDSLAEFEKFIQGKKAEMAEQEAEANELKKLMM